MYECILFQRFFVHSSIGHAPGKLRYLGIIFSYSFLSDHLYERQGRTSLLYPLLPEYILYFLCFGFILEVFTISLFR